MASGSSSSSSSSSSRKRRRSTVDSADHLPSEPLEPPLLKSGDFICPICFELLSEVYVTACGHSFCYRCISHHLSQSPSCPVCKCSLSCQNPIHPNFTLNTVVAKYRQQQASMQARAKTSSPKVQEVSGLLEKIDHKDYPELISLLGSFKQKCEEQVAGEHEHVLLDFLERAAVTKTKELEAVQTQCSAIFSDITTVKRKDPPCSNTQVLVRKKARVHSNFQEILEDYVHVREPKLAAEDSEQDSGLQTFSNNLKQFTSYLSWRELSSLNYGDPSTACSIVSSIEFDRDGDLFAVAGVTKKIKIFNYASILKSVGFQMHYPVHELECEAKLSSVSFNPYHKTTLASADYEGCVNVWDIHTGKKKSSHHEHNKRVWSVVYSPTEPMVYASGSDDSTVKLWSANSNLSIYTLDTKANVCSVQFHPTNRFYMAFGSSDHSIHYMDMRKPQIPLRQLKGHRKAVSYVQFASSSELVSASTDSELKLWDTESGQCLRTYKGHLNEKNFVGLTVSSDFIACGSENNSVYVYSKQISTPMLTYRFSTPTNSLLTDIGTSQEQSGESTDFVSSVCWKKGQEIVLAANSQGHIKVLQMC